MPDRDESPAVRPETAPPAVARTVTLFAAAAFASSVSMRVCDPLLPEFARTFSVGLPAAATTITGFTVSYGVLQLAIGPLGDRVGKYAVVRMAALLGAVASILCALAPGLDALIAARALAGGISGAIIPVALAWIGDEVPFSDRQPVLARVMSGSLLGMVSGQLVGGAFVDTLGWRWAFVALATLFAAVGVLLSRGARGRASPAVPADRDTTATATGTGTAAGAGARTGPSTSRSLEAPVGLLRRYADIARPPWARRILAMVVVEGMLMFGALAFVPSALHDRFGLPLWQAGSVAAAVGAGGFAYTLMARPLVGRIGPRGIAIAGASILAAGLSLVALAPHWSVAAVGCLLMGLGFYGFHNTLQVHGTQLSTSHRGMGMALFALGLFVGQSTGVALVSLLVARVGFAPAFLGAALAFLLLGVSFTRALARRGAVPA